MAVLTVGDDGIGISQAALPRVFDPFVQGDTTLDRAAGGLGLGLALVKSLVEMHHGKVSAASEGEGRGAEFTIRLPLGGSPTPAPPPRPASGHRPRRVFIIEDNADAAQTLRETLELAGHTVEVADDGVQAIERMRDFRPDAALCDIGLPGMDGYAVASAVRRDPELAATYLVAVTGYALPEDLQKARSAGFDEHVPKPAEPGRILATLDAIGDGKRLGRGE